MPGPSNRRPQPQPSEGDLIVRVLFVASEAYPLAKTGGLGDVGRGLPSALAARGADARLLLPGYPSALDSLLGARIEARLNNVMGVSVGRLISGRLPVTGVPDLADRYSFPLPAPRRSLRGRQRGGMARQPAPLRLPQPCRRAHRLRLRRLLEGRRRPRQRLAYGAPAADARRSPESIARPASSPSTTSLSRGTFPSTRRRGSAFRTVA